MLEIDCGIKRKEEAKTNQTNKKKNQKNTKPEIL